jgi:adenylyltransferase/sulfurtransferase
VRVVAHPIRLDAASAALLVDDYEVVVEGSDNQATKLQVNDACVARGRPLVVAGIQGWDGQLLVAVPGVTPCYRCVYREAAPEGSVPTCAAAGVVGPVAGVVGSMQALEALKLLLDLPSALRGDLLLYDGRRGETTVVSARRDPACRACGGRMERA